MSGDLPEIAVIVPAYNAEAFIERCLRSLFSQTIDEARYKIVVIDDGSSDNTYQIVQRYFPDVLLLQNKENKGLAKSLNIGITALSSQYVVRVDADDFVDSRFLEYLLFSIMQNVEFDAVACDYYRVKENEERIDLCRSNENPVGCGIIFRRDKIMMLGLYDEEFRAREEEDLMYRFHTAGYNLLHLPLPLYRYRQTTNSITSNQELMDEFETKLVKKKEQN